jgi:DNA-binding MarR family transcriptional regulator
MHPSRTRPRAPTAGSASHRPDAASEAALAAYAQRGAECAFGNLRMLARAVGAVYEEALRPVDLRAGQLSLMWAIVAAEPVDMGQLAATTLTDQTTLSRTVEKLRRARLVDIARGRDGRRKLLSLSPLGRQRFAAAMPCWEQAQRSVAEWVALGRVQALASRVRRTARRLKAPE